MKETLKTIINGLLVKMRTFRGDWNQNDPSASNYISNRPFYTEHDVETEVLPETILTSGEVTLTTPLVKGQSYKVYWNSVAYECVAREYDGYLMLGNNAIYEYDGGIETDTGEPFALEAEIGRVGLYIYVQSSPWRADSGDSEGNPTLRITTFDSAVHKIDKKYLPDMNYVSFDTYQHLTLKQQSTALENVGDVLGTAIENATTDSIKYTAQSLTAAQQSQARTNIGFPNYTRQTDKLIIAHVTGLETPINDKDAATKGYIDNEIKIIDNKIKIFNCIVLQDRINSNNYIIEMINGELIPQLMPSWITLVTLPNKTTYMVGEKFDPTGMVITATYPDGSQSIVEKYFYDKENISATDTSVKIYCDTSKIHSVDVPITVQPFDESILQDFNYTVNSDGTYTITGWKQTLNGQPSTEMIIPDFSIIKI